MKEDGVKMIGDKFKKTSKTKVYLRALFYWAFFRIFGLLDAKKTIGALLRNLKSKKLVKTQIINVNYDEVVWQKMVEIHYKQEQAPNWWNGRLIKGTEFGKNYEEYWLGMRQEGMLPIIPIPICVYEKVFKMGKDDVLFYQLLNKYYYMCFIREHEDDFSRKIIDEATVVFSNSDLTYKNDEIRSTYD